MSSQESRTHFRWVVVALLFVITVVNYLDRASISYAIDGIAAELGLDDSHIGFILGAFGIGYVITTLLGGVAVDRFGAKRVLAIAISLWTVTSCLTSIADGFFLVFIARILLGVAEGPGFPALSRAVSDWLPQDERNRALSAVLISVPVSLAIGGPITAFFITHFSWRGTYVILGLLALIWVPIWLYLFQDSPKNSTHVNKEELDYINDSDNELHKADNTTVKSILLNRTLMVNNWAFFVFGYYLFFFMTWLPTYLKTTFNLDLTQIGFYSIAPWLSGALMMWSLGHITDAIFNKTKNLRLSRSLPICLTQLLSGLCILPILFFQSLYVSMVCITLAVGLILSANASYFAVVIDETKQKAGTALGVMDAIFAVSGIIAPSLTGIAYGISGNYEVGFYVLTLLGISSSLLVWFFHNR